MEKFLNFLWHVRMVVIAISLIGGGGCAIWVGMRDYRIASAESGPTPLSMDTVDRYGGQRWLTIEYGIFLTDQAVVRGLPRGQDNAEDQAFLYVPTVQRGWLTGSPVHVVAKFGPGPRSKAAGWLQENGRGTLRTFTGVVVNEPITTLFPNLKFSEPVLVVTDGDHLPSAGNSITLIAVGVSVVIGGVALGLWLQRVVWVKLMSSKQNPLG